MHTHVLSGQCCWKTNNMLKSFPKVQRLPKNSIQQKKKNPKVPCFKSQISTKFYHPWESYNSKQKWTSTPVRKWEAVLLVLTRGSKGGSLEKEKCYYQEIIESLLFVLFGLLIFRLIASLDHHHHHLSHLSHPSGVGI